MSVFETGNSHKSEYELREEISNCDFKHRETKQAGRTFISYAPTYIFRSNGYLNYNSPRSVYQYSDMAPGFSGQTSIFDVVLFVSKSLLGIKRQKRLKKLPNFDSKASEPC